MRLKTANIILSPVTATQRITAKPSVPIARILYPVGQPHGASWSGKVAPTKEQRQDKWNDGQAGRIDADFTEDVGGPKLK